jgi:hypothetical protein
MAYCLGLPKDIYLFPFWLVECKTEDTYRRDVRYRPLDHVCVEWY